MRIGFVGFLLGGVGDGLLPEKFAVRSRETHERAQMILLDGLSDEYFVAPHGRRGVPTIGQGNLPTDVLGGAPTQGNVLLRCDARSGWATPSRPVRVQRRGEESGGYYDETQREEAR